MMSLDLFGVSDLASRAGEGEMRSRWICGRSWVADGACRQLPTGLGLSGCGFPLLAALIRLRDVCLGVVEMC